MRGAVEAAVDGVSKTIAPRLKDLEESASRAGMNDRQFELAHEEKMQRLATDAIERIGGKISDDIRPLVTQMAVGALSQRGVDVNRISDLILKGGQAKPPDDASRAAREKWVIPDKGA